MSGPLVLATLAGHKTQTRRLPRPGGFGQPGDRLWVRETWATQPAWDWHAPSNIHQGFESALYYAADPGGHAGRGTWRPSIHMPRWACRLVLEIVEVRTEPLQAITEEDAAQEGLPRNWGDWVDPAGFDGTKHGWLTPAGVRHIAKHPEDDCDDGGMVPGGRAFVFDARDAFQLWWDHINGKRAPWYRNPEVTVITFRRVTS
jgi:hypothetical protein